MANKQIRGIWFHLIMVITIIGMGCLSVWQFHRLAWKNAVIAEMKNHWVQPPVTLATLAKLPRDQWAWRHISLISDEVPQNNLAAALPSPVTAVKLTTIQNGRFGWRDVQLWGTSGWLIAAPWQSAQTTFPQTNGQSIYPDTPLAVVKPVLKPPLFSAHNDTAQQNWYYIDQQLAVALGAEVTDYYLQAIKVEDMQAAPPLPNNNHLQYALTWAALALVVSGMYLQLLWQRRKK